MSKAKSGYTKDEEKRLVEIHDWAIRQIHILRSGTDRRLLRKLKLTYQEVLQLRERAIPEIVTAFVKLYLAERNLTEARSVKYADEVKKAVAFLNANA